MFNKNTHTSTSLNNHCTSLVHLSVTSCILRYSSIWSITITVWPQSLDTFQRSGSWYCNLLSWTCPNTCWIGKNTLKKRIIFNKLSKNKCSVYDISFNYGMYIYRTHMIYRKRDLFYLTKSNLTNLIILLDDKIWWSPNKCSTI